MDVKRHAVAAHLGEKPGSGLCMALHDIAHGDGVADGDLVEVILLG